ncbi:hypothetical protein AAEX63_14700 [Luteococcus sp. H138]|uniref:hypothetical protein n=1 Tax=unclassified Luteococcus TaxID=2639923 RepID=UPI00313D13CC
MSKAERRAAREAVATYHEQQLGALVAHVAEAIDGHRRGELDPFEVDQVIFHYSRAAKELWKFCNLGPVEISASLISREPPIDWWEETEPEPRR